MGSSTTRRLSYNFTTEVIFVVTAATFSIWREVYAIEADTHVFQQAHRVIDECGGLWGLVWNAFYI
jgi:hypothetical protein